MTPENVTYARLGLVALFGVWWGVIALIGWLCIPSKCVGCATTSSPEDRT